jgi:hypothetical protein
MGRRIAGLAFFLGSGVNFGLPPNHGWGWVRFTGKVRGVLRRWVAGGHAHCGTRWRGHQTTTLSGPDGLPVMPSRDRCNRHPRGNIIHTGTGLGHPYRCCRKEQREVTPSWNF